MGAIISTSNTKIATILSIVPIAIILIFAILISIEPSPGLIEGVSPAITWLCGSVGIVGMLFSLKSLSEKNTILKWVAFVLNSLFALMFISSIGSLIPVNEPQQKAFSERRKSVVNPETHSHLVRD